MTASKRPAVPPAPLFGEALPLRPCADVLRFLAHRRSASALTLGEPGPSAQELAEREGLEREAVGKSLFVALRRPPRAEGVRKLLDGKDALGIMTRHLF